MRNVGNLKDSVSGILTGTSLDNVTNLYGAIERAARTMVQQADVPEASGRESFMLYDGVYDYPAPDTIFGGAINDLRPQGASRLRSDYVYKKPIEQFDRTKAELPNGYMVTFEWNAGSPIMRIAQHKADSRIEVDPMDDATDWTATGTASGLATDSTVYYESPAAIRFTLTGSGQGKVEKTLDNPINMDIYEGVGVGFLAIRTPSTDDLADIELRIGSSASDYYPITATEGFLGAFRVDEYLLVAFDLAGAVAVGSPDFEAVDYVGIAFNHTDTIVNMRIGGLFFALPSPHELLFCSAAIFSDDGVLSSTITDDDTEIILNDASYTLLEYESANTISLQNGGLVSADVRKTIVDTLHNKDIGLYPLYRADNPSEEIRGTGNWYDD